MQWHSRFMVIIYLIKIGHFFASPPFCKTITIFFLRKLIESRPKFRKPSALQHHEGILYRETRIIKWNRKFNVYFIESCKEVIFICQINIVKNSLPPVVDKLFGDNFGMLKRYIINRGKIIFFLLINLRIHNFIATDK